MDDNLLLLFSFIGNMVFLSVTGGWNKDPDEEEEEEFGEAKTILINV